MKTIIFHFFLLLMLLQSLISQATVKDSTVFAALISTSYAYHLPGGNMADRFGNNSSIGLSFTIKTKNNWFFGTEGNFIFGNKVKEDGILNNLSTSQGYIIDQDGLYAEIRFYERGFSTFLKFGKLFPWLGPNKNSGFVLIGNLGLLQHKIRIEAETPQLSGDYKKGYDRLTNGLAIGEFIGYLYMGNKRLVNFFAGFEFTQAWTKNRRSYNFDTMEKDNTKRLDLLSGFKIGWIIPLYKKVPDEFYYY